MNTWKRKKQNKKIIKQNKSLLARNEGVEEMEDKMISKQESSKTDFTVLFIFQNYVDLFKDLTLEVGNFSYMPFV